MRVFSFGAYIFSKRDLNEPIKCQIDTSRLHPQKIKGSCSRAFFIFMCIKNVRYKRVNRRCKSNSRKVYTNIRKTGTASRNEDLVALVDNGKHKPRYQRSGYSCFRRFIKASDEEAEGKAQSEENGEMRDLSQNAVEGGGKLGPFFAVNDLEDQF